MEIRSRVPTLPGSEQIYMDEQVERDQIDVMRYSHPERQWLEVAKNLVKRDVQRADGSLS